MRQLEGKALARADLVTGALVSALGLAVFVFALRMPDFVERGVNPLTAPGIFPGVVGIVLTICGAVLVARSWRGTGEGEARPPERRAVLRVMGALAIMVVAVAAVGRVDFRLLVGAVTLAFTGFFLDWNLPRQRLPARLVAVMVTVGLVAVAIPTLFEHVFLVRLP